MSQARLYRPGLLLFFALFMLPPQVRGQHFFRIAADFTIKESAPSGKTLLTKGRAFFDKNHGKILYEVSFPEKETWIATDTSIYRLINGKLKNREAGPYSPAASVFSVFLNGKLEDYGFKGSDFTLIDVEKDKESVITTWSPPKKLSNFLSKVMMSQKNQQLEGMVFFGRNGKPAYKQFFRKYQLFSGMAFPTEVIQISIGKEGETHQLIEYKNILLNELHEQSRYNPVLPD